MLVTHDEIAARLDAIIARLADYGDGRDRQLRMFAEDGLRDLVADVRETAQCEAAIAPEQRDALATVIRDPELRKASGVPEAAPVVSNEPLRPEDRPHHARVGSRLQ